MKKLFFSTLGFIFITLILIVARVSVSNVFSTSGVSLSKIEEQIAAYKKDNIELRGQVLEATSFTRIASRASELGFVKEKSWLFLSSKVPVAMTR